MKCRKCGADLLDTDTFCVKCGQKVGQPMFCSHCGEELRDEERFCHKCGSPVKDVPEDEEIPLSRQRTVDIPFDQIEQAILMEAEQAVVKRPKGEEPARRTPPSRPRPVEDYDDYEEDEEDDDEESGSSRMKLVTIILGIVVVVVALLIGFIFWQKNRTPNYGQPDETTEQGQEADGEAGEDGEQFAEETRGRIQILSNVNVRNKPSKEDSKVLMVAKAGDIYEYYELVDEAWYHIKVEDGKEGYVSAKYVEDLK